MIKYKIYLVIYIIATVVLLSSCVSTGDIEGIVDKGGKAITTVQVANAGKALAETRKIKAKTKRDNDRSMAAMTSKMTQVMQAKLISEKMQTDVKIANSGWLRGFMMGLLTLMIIIYLAKVIKWAWHKPISETKNYQTTRKQ